MGREVTTSVSVEFRSGGYTDAQIEQLASDLSGIGPTRTKPFYAPTAIEHTLIEFVLSYIGAKLVDHTVVKPSLRLLSKAIERLRASKAEANENPPALFKVVYSFDDLDVVVFHPSQQDLQAMDETLALVHERLSTGLLKDSTVTLVEMPLVRERGGWDVPDYADAMVEGPLTLWAITTAYWEGKTRAPYDASKDEWLSAGRVNDDE